MTLTLICAAAVVILGLLLSRFSSRAGIPVLLGFILLGMVFGSDGLLKIPFENFDFANQICSVALIFIIFYGGFGMSWRRAKPVMVPAVLLSTLGVVLTAGVMALFCRFALGMDWLDSLLVGSILSSTDAASVFSILRAKRLNLRFGTASLLEMESGSNDPAAYTLTVLVLSLMRGGVSSGEMVWMAFSQVAFGLLCGAGLAVGSVWFFRRLKNPEAGVGTLLIFAIALLSYALPTLIGGNGYLSTYLVGVVLGHQNCIPEKKAAVHFMDGVTSLMQMALFFLLGLLSFPSLMPRVLPMAVGITLFLTLVARPAVVFLLLLRRPEGRSRLSCLRQKLLISWAGLRGATSIVFAIMAVIDPASISVDIFHIAFCVVLLSIGVQGSLLPWAARRLSMIDTEADIMRTFNDYSSDTPIQFIRLHITPEHPWQGKTIMELALPPDLQVAMVLRGEAKVIPRGNTLLQPGDLLILTTLAYEENRPFSIIESEVEPDGSWQGRTLADIDWGNALVVLVRREGKMLIPTGRLRLKAGDQLVLASGD